MSYKLFNERIANAIDKYKDRSGWASIENVQFCKEIFSGSYNEKNLEQLKLFIKRHNQSFTWKEDGSSFFVKRSQRQEDLKRKSSKGIWAGWVETLIAFFRRFFGIDSHRHAPKKRAKKTLTSTETSNAVSRAVKREDRRPKGQELKNASSSQQPEFKKDRSSKNRNQRDSYIAKRSRQDYKKKNAEGSLTSKGEEGGTPRQQKLRNEKGSNRSSGNTRGERVRVSRFSDFATTVPYTAYIDTCNRLIDNLSEKIFTSCLDGDFDQPKVNLPAYLSNIYVVRAKADEISRTQDQALFHTGLFDKSGQPVYMHFVKKTDFETNNDRLAPPYAFADFILGGDPEAVKQIQESFPTLPLLSSPLKYFNLSLDLLFFNRTAQVQFPHKDEFLRKNLFYFPEKILENIPALKGYKEELEGLKAFKRVEKMQLLASEVEKDKELYRSLRDRLFEAIDRAIAHARKQPRFASPGVDVVKYSPLLLLPVHFDGEDGDENKDNALFYMELFPSEGNNYRCDTLCSHSKATLAMRTLNSLSDKWI